MTCHLHCMLVISLPKPINVQQQCFISRNVDLLVRAYVTYVRPIVENDSVVWSPYTVKDIDNIESVQRCFTKRLPGFGALTDAKRLRRLGIPSLELRRLHADLFYCYKVITRMRGSAIRSVRSQW